MVTTVVHIKITDEGLLLPREAYEDLGEVEVLRQANRIIIQPKRDGDSRVQHQVIQTLREASLLADPLWSSSIKPVSLEERAELARKLGSERHLSEIVIEEREAGW